jgi:PhzF family phenazine biosynthesis protein
MSWPLFQVDAFTAEPFAGNPAAVCLLETDADPAWMQSVAAEMNLSETAFLRRSTGRWRLRWFTPTVEVELCGHATLASAHVLFSEGLVEAGEPVRFDSASGPLAARRDGDGAIWLDFPATPAAPVDPPAGLLDALGVGAAGFVGRARFDYLVELADESAVRALAPDLRALGGLAVDGVGVIVTAPAAPGAAGHDFVSRYFAPSAGIDEDPVTGSAHCVLGPFWAERLGRDDLTGFQASARGGLVRVRPRGDRTHLGGRAVTVLRGRLV